MPALVRRLLLCSIRYEDLLERFRLPLEEIFIVSVVLLLVLLHVEVVMSLHGDGSDVMDVNVEQDFDDTSLLFDVVASKPNASVWRMMLPQDSTAAETAAAASDVRRGREGIVCSK